MCFEYESEYLIRRAEEARKALQQAEEARRKAQAPKPGEPAPQTGPKESEPVPV